MSENVALVGYGIMGAAIAGKLVESGYGVLVYDVSDASLESARARGLETVASLTALAQRASITLLCLPKPEHVTAVVRDGDDCLLAGAREGAVIVDTSTVDPETSRRNAAAAAERGVGYLDGPVLGRPSACGNWTLPTGGEERYIEAARPVLETFAAKIVPVGPVGAGNTVKLLNNLMFGAINAVTCEVFALSKRIGMDPGLLFETISNSGAGTVSKLFQELGPKIVADSFEPNFTIANMHKDVGLGLALARESAMTLAVSEAGQHLNERALAAGLGNVDTAAVVKVCERDEGEASA